MLSPEQTQGAVEAGAQRGLASGLNPRVVRVAAVLEWFFIPGVMPPSDVELALESGVLLLKFFPAREAGGTANLAEYRAQPGVPSVGGSWRGECLLIRSGRVSEIERLSREAVRSAGVDPFVPGAAGDFRPWVGMFNAALSQPARGTVHTKVFL